MIQNKVFASSQKFIGRIELSDEELGTVAGAQNVNTFDPPCDSGCFGACRPEPEWPDYVPIRPIPPIIIDR